MPSKRVRSLACFLQGSCFRVVMLHPCLEVLLSAPYVDLVGHLTLNLVNYNGGPTNIVVPTLTSSAVALQSLEIFRTDPHIHLLVQILLEQLSQIRESVVRH